MAQDVTSQITVSQFVDGQGIDAADFTVPYSQIATIINNILNGVQAADKKRFAELASDPTAPTAASGEWIVYAKSGGIYVIDDTGAVTGPFGAGGAGGAPTDAKYIVQTADGTLSNEQALSTLQTGAVQVTTTTGVLSSLKSNTTTTVPTVDNDTDENYSVGSIWYDTTADKAYICLDNTDGAAVWKEITQEASATNNDYICIEDQKTQNTGGGTFTTGAWQTRTLNTEVADDGGHATLSSNQISLVAGTYRFSISAPAYGVARHKARLQNVTDGTTVKGGTSEYASGGGTAVTQSRSLIHGQFTIADTKVFEVQHYGAVTVATRGFGVESNFDVEVYTVAEFWKVA